MRKVLLRASYPFALCFFLSVTALAAAPSFLSVNTDKYRDVTTQVSLGVPGVTGNVASIQNNAPAAFLIGVTNVQWTGTDRTGNWDTTTQMSKVIDNELPVINAPENIQVSSYAGSRASVSANSTILAGHTCHHGTYFAEIMQGEK